MVSQKHTVVIWPPCRTGIC